MSVGDPAAKRQLPFGSCVVVVVVVVVVTVVVGATVVVVVVVELPQAPEDDPYKRLSCSWKAEELVTVGACMQLVVAMVGWVEAGMELVDGRQAGQNREDCSMSRDAGALSECKL